MSFTKYQSLFMKCPSIFALVFIGLNVSQAQDSLMVLHEKFPFIDGIYFSNESLINNQPDIHIDQLDIIYTLNTKTQKAQVSQVLLKNSNNVIPQININTIVLNSKPYFPITLQHQTAVSVPTYVSPQILGEVSYISYHDKITTQSNFSAYNPINGRPFRTATIQRQEDKIINLLYHFPTGNKLLFTKDNLLKLINNDQALTKALQDQKNPNHKTLLKTLLIYLDRHPFSLPISSSEQLKY